MHKLNDGTLIFPPFPEGKSLTAISATDGGHTFILGHSAKGKSMLDRLTDEERREWSCWMDENPGVNGMTWPGWSAVVEREMTTAHSTT